MRFDCRKKGRIYIFGMEREEEKICIRERRCLVFVLFLGWGLRRMDYRFLFIFGFLFGKGFLLFFEVFNFEFRLKLERNKEKRRI